MLRTLFLDFDGVLNCSRTFGEPVNGIVHPKIDPIDPECIRNLNRVTLSYHLSLNIVVSSTWRKTRTIKELDDLLEDHGLKGFNVIDKTPVLNKRRGYEIRDWLLDHPEYNAGLWCIVDDDNDMLPEQQERFVQTTFKDGLTFEKAKDIMRILKLGDFKNG